MRDIQRSYLDTVLVGHALGIAAVSIAVVFGISDIDRVILGSPHPVPVFGLVCLMFGSFISCARFGFDIVNLGLEEQARDRERAAREKDRDDHKPPPGHR